MEFKGTKGKWIVDVTDASIKFDPDFHNIMSSKDYLVAKVRLDIDSLTECEANTKLIAASTELLGLAQMIHSQLTDQGGPKSIFERAIFMASEKILNEVCE